MNKWTHSDNLASDIVRHLTSVKSLKQLFITTVLLSNIMGIYDLLFNQGQGVKSLISAYQELSPSIDNPVPVVSSEDISYITRLVSEYPSSRVSVLQILPDTGLEPVTRSDGTYQMAIYRQGRPVALLLIDAPLVVQEGIYYYFKGYDNFSPVPKPTTEQLEPEG